MIKCFFIFIFIFIFILVYFTTINWIITKLEEVFRELEKVLKGLIEKYNKPNWILIARILSENRVPTEKYNIPTELQKKLGAVTDKYFLIEGFVDKYRVYKVYWIFIRQPDGTLGEKKGVLTFTQASLKAFPLDRWGLDELNEMCDKEVQAEPLKRRRRALPDSFTSL